MGERSLKTQDPRTKTKIPGFILETSFWRLHSLATVSRHNPPSSPADECHSAAGDPELQLDSEDPGAGRAPPRPGLGSPGQVVRRRKGPKPPRQPLPRNLTRPSTKSSNSASSSPCAPLLGAAAPVSPLASAQSHRNHLTRQPRGSAAVPAGGRGLIRKVGPAGYRPPSRWPRATPRSVPAL